MPVIASPLDNLVQLTSASRTTQVVEQMTDWILSGELEDTTLLPPERILAEKLGVSRSVVREAAQILQSRGLLSIKHGVGTMVTRHSSEPVQRAFSHALYGEEEGDALLKLIEVRLLVEVEIAALAAERATESDLSRIRDLLDEMEAALDTPQRYVELDMAFHLALAEATSNAVFALVLEASAILSREVRVRSLASGSTTRQSQAKHRAIFEAVAARDVKAASEQMREHLWTIESDVRQSLSGIS